MERMTLPLTDLSVLMARQSVVDVHHAVFGFEVLYRGDSYNPERATYGMEATNEVLNNICSCVFDHDLTSGRPLLINVDQTFIESPGFYPNPSNTLILELLETVKATPVVLRKIRELKQLGFEFALDDYAFEKERAAFLPYVSMVKIDVQHCSIAFIDQHIHLLQQYPVTLLAEKVEDYETFAACEALGFTLFQGFYLEKPRIVHGKKVTADSVVTLKLLAELTRQDISVEEVANLIACDPRLAMKVLLLVNSSLFSFVRKVEDIKEAVVMLGLKAVKQWAMIILLMSESQSPREIFRFLLTRAKTLELYRAQKNADGVSDYFNLGLFSGLDAILGIKMEYIMQAVPLSEDISAALISREGPMGDLLVKLSRIERKNHYEQASNSDDSFMLCNAYWQGVAWADELMDTITEH